MVRNPPACRRHKRHGFDPWVGKIPWSRKWQPALVFLSGKFQRQRCLTGYSPQGCKEKDVTKHTHTHTQLYLYLCVCVSHSVMSICDLMDCSLPGSSVHGFSMQEYQSGSPFPSPEALPHPGIEPGSPALQIDSLLTEPLGKPQTSPIMGLEPTTLRLRASCFTE